jgi:hypothetical protein
MSNTALFIIAIALIVGGAIALRTMKEVLEELSVHSRSAAACVALARRTMKKVLEELSARRLASSHNARAVSKPSLSMSRALSRSQKFEPPKPSSQ